VALLPTFDFNRSAASWTPAAIVRLISERFISLTFLDNECCFGWFRRTIKNPQLGRDCSFVRVPTLSALKLDQWVEQFEKLKKLNHQLTGGKAPARAAGKRESSRKRRK
jgi:hypothetical protein